MTKQAQAASEEEGLLARRASQSSDDVERGDSRGVGRSGEAAGEKARRSGLLAALLYGSTSITITFFNKAVFFVWHFDYPVTISLLQVTLSLLLFVALHAHGTIQLPALSIRVMGMAAPLAIFWCLNVLSGIFTLQYMSIPMFSTLRRLTTLIVLIGEHVLLRKYATRPVWVAVIIMTLGALIAGISDLDFNPVGYMCVTVNNLCTAAYLLLIQVTKRDLQVSNLQLLFLMNLCSLPFLVVTCLIFDAQLVLSYAYLRDPSFLMVLFCSCLQVRAASPKAPRSPDRPRGRRVATAARAWVARSRGERARARARACGAARSGARPSPRARELTPPCARLCSALRAALSRQAFVLNYATFLCTTLNSGVTTSITGQMSKLVTMTVGLFLFVNTKYTVMNLTGLFIGLISSFWYAYIKFVEGRSPNGG